MMKTNAQRQRAFREKRRSNFKRVELFLPLADAENLKQRSERLEITQSAYIAKALRLADDTLDFGSEPPYKIRSEVSPSNVTGNDSYDGATALTPAIADLIGCSPKSVVKISKIMQEAKSALNITTKSKRLPADLKVKIYRHIRDTRAQ